MILCMQLRICNGYYVVFHACVYLQCACEHHIRGLVNLNTLWNVKTVLIKHIEMSDVQGNVLNSRIGHIISDIKMCISTCQGVHFSGAGVLKAEFHCI